MILDPASIFFPKNLKKRIGFTQLRCLCERTLLAAPKLQEPPELLDSQYQIRTFEFTNLMAGRVLHLRDIIGNAEEVLGDLDVVLGLIRREVSR